MAPALTSHRQSFQTAVGRMLPPVVAVPLRALAGGSREPELAVLRTFVEPGDTVIDVGAHRGVYTCRLAWSVGRHGRVIAYEPQPEMIDYLRAASRLGPMSRVELRPRALSDTEGEAVLSVPVENGVRVVGQATLRDVGKADAHRVPVVLLDHEPMPGRVSFIKVDVEGHELALFRGARRLLGEDRPVLLVEVEVRHAGHRVAELAQLLLDELGYTAFELDGAQLTPVARTRWDDGSLNDRPEGRYVNNFVFRY